MKNRRIPRLVLIIMVIALFALLLAWQAPAAATGPGRVAFINVGEGDAALLQDGNGFDVLIDGGEPAAGPTVVAYLRQQGVNDIDVMVNTNPDADHVGGLIDVLQQADIPVKAVLFNGYSGTTTTWYDFATAVAKDGLTLTPAQYPMTYTWGDMTVQVLNPESGLSDPESDNASVVLRVEHNRGGVFLFTGDIDSTQEARLLDHGPVPTVTVLKVARHGSSFSSGADFLAAVWPDNAVISVGPNPYGYPGADILARLVARADYIWRTDKDGTIVVECVSYPCAVTGTSQHVYLPLVAKSIDR